MIGAGHDPSTARKLACEAYIFGYPLVLTDTLRATSEGASNRFEHVRTLAALTPGCDPDPNVHSLCSIARLDLSAGPVIVTLPDLGGRCFSATFLDAWTDVFASVGSHSCGWRGARGGDYVVVGPSWRGEAVDGLSALRAPSNHVLLVVRILARCFDDLAVVRTLQDGLHITPLGAEFGRVASNWIAKEPALPLGRMSEADVERYFNRLNALMFSHPPARTRNATANAFTAIGVAPGRRFSLADAGQQMIAPFMRGVCDGHALIQVETLAAISHDRGWRVEAWSERGDPLTRAARAMKSLDLVRHERAVHAVAHRDANGHPLHGSRLYCLHFDSGPPPVENFWCIGVHRHGPGAGGELYSLCAMDRAGANASAPVEICISSEQPPAMEGRYWLSAPSGAFSVGMDFYQPQRALREGSWRLPALERWSKEALPGTRAELVRC